MKKGDLCPNCGKEIIYNQQIVCKYCGNKLKVKKTVEKIVVKEVEARTEKRAPFATPQIPNFEADRKKIESKKKAKFSGQISLDNGQIQEAEVEILQEIESELKLQLIKVDNNEFNTKIGFMVENNRVIGINLHNCEIVKIPESIINLTSLKKLNLSYNQIETLPESIRKLRSLENLDLSNNVLKFFPKSLNKLVLLNELKLSVNEITAIPESIINLTLLTKLDLSYNEITIFPKSICLLSSLEELNLRVNQLEAIPKLIMNLISLTKLDLSYNVLFDLPESIKNLLKLKTLLLLENPLRKMMDKETKVLIKFLKQKGVSVKY